MRVLIRINTKLTSNDKKPTNTKYGIPSADMNKPPVAAPTVIPKLPTVRNKPLENSGASGAEETTQY